MPVAIMKERILAISSLLKDVMKEGIDRDYAVIPGTGQKSLLKPGAEKILVLFGMSASFDTTDLSTDIESRYRVQCNIQSKRGDFLGSVSAECSSFEEKFAWRACKGEMEWNDTPEVQKRLCYKSGTNGEYTIRQIRTSKADSAQKCLMMAQKRAMVGAVRMVTAASDIFTQDLEDMDPAEHGPVAGERAPISQPKATATASKPAPATTTTAHAAPVDGEVALSSITDVQVKTGTSAKGKEWTLYTMTDASGERYATFDKKIAEAAEQLMASESSVAITWKMSANGKGKELLAIEARDDV